MKKGKVISMPVTPEAQIRSRARNLPLDLCYINDNWEDSHMAMVIVTRKHVNGNITYGGYLVDLYLLGVKDCFYAFNEIPSKLEERLDNWELDFVECDYVLAHNVIYESVAFAENYGFAPVKDFTKTGIYVLEEDSDQIPEMDIPLGKDGLPVVFVDPYNDHRREIAILDKMAGSDNYIVYHIDKDGNHVDEDGNIIEDLDDDTFLTYYEEILDEILDIGISAYIDQYKENLDLIQTLALTDITYGLKFGKQDETMFHKMNDLIIGDPRFDPTVVSIPGMDKYADSIQSIVDKMKDDQESALAEMEALIANHPDDIDLALLHINLLRDMELPREVEQLTRKWYDRARNHYIMRLLYAEWLIDQKRFDEVFELFGNQPGLDALTTEDVPFTDVIIAEFCACYVQVWLSKNNIEKADHYYRMLIALDVRTPFVLFTLLNMAEKKKKAVLELLEIAP